MFEHNRYLIYQLKSQHVLAAVPRILGGYKIKGVVDDVFRDVMEGNIEIKVGDNVYIFNEPHVILENSGSINFIYGKKRKEGDEILWDEFREVAQSGGSINEALENTAKNVKVITFEITESKSNRKKRTIKF